MQRSWWLGAVGYEVYIRSFDDHDGDGIGDLPGLRRRLRYLRDLGVDVVWITPFFPSPQADHGYDVADYRGVDPVYGTLDDVDALLADAHELELRIVFDLVANHSSDQHPWFQAALRGEDPYVDYYVWRDPAPDGGPPNNWVSHFGGPAWTYREERDQYYLHQYLPEQPDLNWESEPLRREFDQLLAYWFDRGVDGLRIDAAHALVVDPQFRDNPLVGEPPGDGTSPGEVYRAYDHRYDRDQPGVVEIYERWRPIADEAGAMLLGEVYLMEGAQLSRYVSPGRLHATFAFAPLHATWNAAEIRATLHDAVAHCEDRLAWALSSHDDPRAAERFGGGARGARRALAYWTLLSALPGTAFLYQGDELGLDDGRVTRGADPLHTRNPGVAGRDGARTPMLWEPDPDAGYGFTTGTPWLEFGRNRSPEQSVAAQLDDPMSHLERTRRWHEIRRHLADLTGAAPVRWIDAGEALVAFRRGRTVVACNVGPEPATLAGVDGVLRWCSAGHPDRRPDGTQVPADATVVIESPATP